MKHNIHKPHKTLLTHAETSPLIYSVSELTGFWRWRQKIQPFKSVLSKIHIYQALPTKNEKTIIRD